MTQKQRSDLLSSLRALDDHWGQVEPDPAFEQRLLSRLQPGAKKSRNDFAIFAQIRSRGRPLLLLAAAIVVLILSLSDTQPTARSGVMVPPAPDAAVEPAIETPEEERMEPARPHLHERPQNPRFVPADPPDPHRQNEPRNEQPVFPEQPAIEWEQIYIPPKFRGLIPHRTLPKSQLQEHSEFLPHWSAGQTIPLDTHSRSSNMSSMQGGGGSSRPKPPPETSVAECFSKETFKQRAADDCEQSGLTLSNIVYVNPCKGGLYQHAEHECTEIAPEEDGCITGTVTDGDQCVDPGQLKMLAWTACKMAIMDLVDFTYASGDCGWKARKGTYTCCPFQPPPPSPAVCQGETIGDGVTCMDPGAMKDEAFYHCQGLGQVLGDIYPAMDCPDGQASMAKITCCK